jgi:hypothetical protein
MHHRIVRSVVAAVAVGMALLPGWASAQGTECPAGQAPHYVFGFADLSAFIGAEMGQPLTCEFADPNGTGDIHQRTTNGLAFWRKSTNTPTFTDGFDHWGHTPAGWVHWTGASIDPPPTAEVLDPRASRSGRVAAAPRPAAARSAPGPG